MYWGFVATALGLLVLAALVGDLFVDGRGRLTLDFFFTAPGNSPDNSGILTGWVGSLLLILTTALIAVPIGVGAGLYLEEYAPRNSITSALEVATNNLAGVPSIVFGLLGLALFTGVIGGGRPTVLVAGMTLALLVLPVIIVATREAVRGVPQGIREAALSVGATRLQTTSHHVLPYATPGIVTGVIIGVSRALGETAPLIVLSVPAFVQFLPGLTTAEIGKVNWTGDEIGFWDVVASWAPFGANGWLSSDFTVMPLLMYDWTERPQAAFKENAAAAGIILLALTLTLNAFAIWYRYEMRKKIRW